jgi:hypothetical protein
MRRKELVRGPVKGRRAWTTEGERKEDYRLQTTD